MSSELFKTVELPTGETYTQPIGFYIDGSWHKSDVMIESINPATEEPIVSVYAATESDVDTAVIAARKAFKKWTKEMTGTEKGRLLYKLADILEENVQLVAKVEAMDSGKPYEATALGDIESVVEYLRYCAGWADKIMGKAIPISGEKFAMAKRQPLGVCAQIVPWNYPLSMSGWKIAPALAAGNAIIIKSAENTPLSLLLFAQYVEKAGFPKGIVNIISGYGATAGARLANHPDIDKIAFTGSTKVGAMIQQMASSNLKTVTLECGGKSPLLVFEDADLEQAAKWAAFGIMFNSGQNCTANSRIIVQESVYEKFLEIFKKEVKESWRLGDPFDSKSTVGPVISKVQYDRIREYIQIGKDEGAKVLFGDEPVKQTKGYYIPPTAFYDCNQKMRIVQEEIFGPVVAISTFTDEEDAITKANDTIYGLAAMVFTKDIFRGHRVADEIDAGSVYINSSNDEDIKVPFGGFKSSGFGRELGENGIELYTQVKAVHCNMGSKL